MAVAQPAAIAQFIAILIAFATLIAGFVGNDFSVALIASHSNTDLPLELRIAATWGSHEGSMLLWSLMASGWTCAVAAFSRSLSPVLRARILGVLGLISVGFLLFLLFTSNPFERLLPPAVEGRDLNPLLQDPGMVFHPPLLYMGYVGLSVAFAFAIAGLLGGGFDAAWARWARPWTTVAWCFLTLGIALGSFWAYYELGWGGWWFWDPVENASFMPWLVATALIHSLAVAEKRGTFRSWTVLLAILGFSLSLMGTFLVRSGVLTSVHAFATDPARGVFILAFLVIVIGGSLTLFAWRAPQIGAGNAFGPVSRESMLLANNILLVVAMAAVMLGTLYPLVLDTLGLGKISVGPPYFEAVFVPVMAPALFLIAVGPLARWKRTELPPLVSRLRWAFAISVISGLAAPVAAVAAGVDGPAWRPLTSIGLAFGFWITAGVVVAIAETLRTPGRAFSIRHAASRARMQPPSVWGMHLAHLGVAAFVFGVTLVNSYEIGTELRAEVGHTITVGDYRLTFTGLDKITGPNYDADRGHFEVRDSAGRLVTQLHPEKRIYRASGQPMTEAAIDRSLLRDVYVSMGEPLGGTVWAIRAHVKPFVNWIWLGCVMMAAGGFIAVADKRYRRRLAERESRAAVAAHARA
ncbi:MAG: heme lyase CcmF/NrfE family subunit, partial [Gemmatimonadales bacterium]|nr:heme lyase CcmF/NrfE family subunit [Gemmatimonadales bacterium]